MICYTHLVLCPAYFSHAQGKIVWSMAYSVFIPSAMLVTLQSDCFMIMTSRTAINGNQRSLGSWSTTQETKSDRTRERTSKRMPGLPWLRSMYFWACQLPVWSSWASDVDKIILGLSEVNRGFRFCKSSFLGVQKLWEEWSLQRACLFGTVSWFLKMLHQHRTKTE